MYQRLLFFTLIAKSNSPSRIVGYSTKYEKGSDQYDKDYKAYWALKMDGIIEELKSGKFVIEIDIRDIANYKHRRDYYADFKILQVKITDDSSPMYRKGRRIHARDFVRILKKIHTT